MAHQVTLEDSVLANAQAVFDAARTGYEEGKLDYLKLLDAQRTLFSAQAQVLKAQASVRLARADLDYASGQAVE